MTLHIKAALVILTFHLLPGKINAQALPKTIVKKIDKLFETWDKTNSPGCVVGIVRNDSLIFSKGYGMANLEYKIPITTETIFYMCSVSKQFTGYATVLLARQGKINLDEDIHVYLPWLADFGKRITIRNLLNHTSGIRDDINLAAISGLGTNGMVTQQLALNLLRRQRSLNFDPGERYSYSNSNFVLLSEIVKGVSGKSFRAFADSAIFKPLSMANTHFQDDYAELIKNRAFSYQKIDSNHFANDFQNVYTLGDGGLFTNVEDMAKWITNFYNTSAGDSSDIHQLAEKGKLNNKKEINYALGITVDNYKGKKVFSHGGALAGYRTFTCIFPNLKMGFIVFSNVGDFNPLVKAFQVANFFLDPEKTGNAEALQKKENSTTYSEGLFQSNGFSGNSQDEEPLSQKQVVDTNWSDKQLQAYTGIFYCSELDCRYSIALKDHKLFLTSNKYDDAKLDLVDANHLTNDFWWMGRLLIIRNSKKQITGFEINTDRVMHLRFDKID